MNSFTATPSGNKPRDFRGYSARPSSQRAPFRRVTNTVPRTGDRGVQSAPAIGSSIHKSFPTPPVVYTRDPHRRKFQYNRPPQYAPRATQSAVNPSVRPANVPSMKIGTGADVVRIIPLGGCEEVGRNMTVFEYGDDIVILDMGLQFPEEDMPGIDYIIPNVKYLAGREKNIRGVIFSHGHLDHIGAAPILLEKLNNPPIIGRDLTLALVKHKQ